MSLGQIALAISILGVIVAIAAFILHGSKNVRLRNGLGTLFFLAIIVVIVVFIFSTMKSTSLFPKNLCYGSCWQHDEAAKTMTWTGITDGREDIWFAKAEDLQKIQNGYTAIINVSVPGEIYACVLTINDRLVKNSCDNQLIKVSEGTHRIQSTNPNVGGFR